MNKKFKAVMADTKILFRSIPSVIITLFTVAVILMNILANKTVFQNDWIAVDGGFMVSWLSFLCMDIITRAFGPKAATKVSVFALLINLFVCVLFYITASIPTETDFSAFNTVIGGTWFILLSSSIAFISSAVINNFLNWNIGRLFSKNPNGKLAYVTSCYVSTFVGQFCDNFIFASLTFMFFAPIFWNGFHWTPIQCINSSILGALLELFMEVIFSPIGYMVLKEWQKDGIGKEYVKEYAYENNSYR